MKQPKTVYRVRNWKEYDQALAKRGSLTFWIDEAVIAQWHQTQKSGKRGASRTYSDAAIQAMASLKRLFALPGRACEGFLGSVFGLMGLALPVPDHSTLSRRLGQLSLCLAVPLPSQPRHLVLDSSGFKVYGEGEWKVRVHGQAYRRGWLKLHLGVDANTQEIVISQVTCAKQSDARVGEKLIRQTPGKLGQVSADGAYDAKDVYEAVALRGARATIRPNPRGKKPTKAKTAKAKTAKAKTAKAKTTNTDRARNVARVEEIGLRAWKLESGYSRRSLVETGYSRLKRRFGDKLFSRNEENQQVELQLLTLLLNRVTHLGMPKTQRVTL